MSCLLGYVQNPRTAGHLKAGNITSLFKTWYFVFATDVIILFDWDYSSDWDCSMHTRKASAVGQETWREHFEDRSEFWGL